MNVVYRRKKIKINIPMKFLFEENVNEMGRARQKQKCGMKKKKTK